MKVKGGGGGGGGGGGLSVTWPNAINYALEACVARWSRHLSLA